jgi:hypothetical protein
MGAKEGAWCAIDTVRQPVLRVNGMTEGLIEASILTKAHSVPFLMLVDKDGDYPLSEHSAAMMADGPMWIRVSATHPTSDLVCLVVPKPRAA